MTATKYKPFKRGDWVFVFGKIELVNKVRWCDQIGDWIVFTNYGTASANNFRSPTVRELRAESARLTRHVASLDKAATAAARQKRRERP